MEIINGSELKGKSIIDKIEGFCCYADEQMKFMGNQIHRALETEGHYSIRTFKSLKRLI